MTTGTAFASGPTHARVVRESGVAYVTVGDATRLNALTQQQWEQLGATAAALHEDGETSAVVFRGAGHHFCAGSRIDGWQDATSEQVDADFGAMETALRAVEAIRVPTIAVMEGVAAGAGCQLALACDVRMVATSARLGMPILRLGILCSPAFALRLSALCGPSRAKELLFSGRLVDAPEAARYGLVTHVVPDDQLDAAVQEWSATLCAQPRSALVAAKQAAEVCLQSLRREHEAPGWRYSDPTEFGRRVRSFLARRRLATSPAPMP